MAAYPACEEVIVFTFVTEIMAQTIHQSLAILFSELVDGAAADGGYMLNRGDPGLLRSLDGVTATEASTPATPGSASIAAHVDHVCYGLELMNRWSDGERDPWSGADWAASWRRGAVNDKEWTALRERLRAATRRWHAALQQPREMSAIEMNTVVGSVAHLAYHIGAIRQINRTTQGPKAE
jgi:hypothetical protein